MGSRRAAGRSMPRAPEGGGERQVGYWWLGSRRRRTVNRAASPEPSRAKVAGSGTVAPSWPIDSTIGTSRVAVVQLGTMPV